MDAVNVAAGFQRLFAKHTGMKIKQKLGLVSLHIPSFKQSSNPITVAVTQHVLKKRKKSLQYLQTS